ncbi:MAG TPA: protein-L-isoaspartate(D-aspartate) O-methyltransferase [Candidatus Acidoferrales bacterium]|nr:protein-L-isoaspartate(D-aspartate) O-methyltransferase [Candidatus Acidoferrales bacterium]
MFQWHRRAKDAHDEFEFLRRNMVERQIRDRGIRDPRVLAAMLAVPRHSFVPIERIADSYADAPLPIGDGQTISQPFMVAAMADSLALLGHESVLEIGAGSGYQAAVLSLLAREVIAIETKPRLAAISRERLAHLGYANVQIIEADGSAGWPANAPYDGIVVSAAAPSVPRPLFDQLAEGGRIVIPVGDSENQQVLRIVKCGGEPVRERLYRCRFVPLVGEHGWPDAIHRAPSE